MYGVLRLRNRHLRVRSSLGTRLMADAIWRRKISYSDEVDDDWLVCHGTSTLDVARPEACVYSQADADSAKPDLGLAFLEPCSCMSESVSRSAAGAIGGHGLVTRFGAPHVGHGVRRF